MNIQLLHSYKSLRKQYLYIKSAINNAVNDLLPDDAAATKAALALEQQFGFSELLRPQILSLRSKINKEISRYKH